MTIRDINDIINAVCPNDEDYEKPCISPKYLRQELEKLALEQEQYYLESNCSEIPTGSTTKNDLALINTLGLDEEIRCTMCTNHMKSDSGCDGSCVVNEDMYKAVINAIEKRIQPTTKNNLPHCQCMDAEITKSFIEDVEAVKDQLPCGQMMDFPNTFDEFAKDYGFKDKDEVYTNGIELIPVYRVKQWLEHISTTKNDLGVDCIDRQATLDAIIKRLGIKNETYLLEAERAIYQQILAMPSVTPKMKPRKGHWIVQPSNKEQGERDFIWWKCSECGQVIFSETEHDRLEFHSFCGRCGSDNREVEE